ncbi:hypothetical protein FB45DRAFT_1096177 [Roridomyces roridus]|uniref:Alpha-type protein kinase domain-containing protein n=1 Tax=Roridomyces roridus TaxID=1738132 RepID=A0AAD7BFM6_9AGAR|nr:hypothetical protein FB45DRAFT_1096177 [Roridomyces roridus]
MLLKSQLVACFIGRAAVGVATCTRDLDKKVIMVKDGSNPVLGQVSQILRTKLEVVYTMFDGQQAGIDNPYHRLSRPPPTAHTRESRRLDDSSGSVIFSATFLLGFGISGLGIFCKYTKHWCRYQVGPLGDWDRLPKACCWPRKSNERGKVVNDAEWEQSSTNGSNQAPMGAIKHQIRSTDKIRGLYSNSKIRRDRIQIAKYGEWLGTRQINKSDNDGGRYSVVLVVQTAAQSASDCKEKPRELRRSIGKLKLRDSTGFTIVASQYLIYHSSASGSFKSSSSVNHPTISFSSVVPSSCIAPSTSSASRSNSWDCAASRTSTSGWESYQSWLDAELPPAPRTQRAPSQSGSTQRPPPATLSTSTSAIANQLTPTIASESAWSKLYEERRNRQDNDETQKTKTNVIPTTERPTTPPPRKRTLQYMSPDRAQLRKVMAVGGSSDAVRASAVPVTSQQIQLYPVEIPALHHIISEGGLTHFYCDPASASMGTLTIQISTQIGKGAFKQHTLDWLHVDTKAWWDRWASLGTVKTKAERVCCGEVYLPPKREVLDGVARYSAADEHMKTIEEANLLFWGSVLFEFTCSFINQFISDAPETIPFSIPHLRFVRAAVAVVHQAIQGTTVGNTSTVSQTFLLEEFINAPAERHVQYAKTGGLMFISDYQVNLRPLRDVKSEKDKDLFGDGNVGSIFKKFPTQHQCNKYCNWFRLGRLAYDGPPTSKLRVTSSKPISFDLILVPPTLSCLSQPFVDFGMTSHTSGAITKSMPQSMRDKYYDLNNDAVVSNYSSIGTEIRFFRATSICQCELISVPTWNPLSVPHQLDHSADCRLTHHISRVFRVSITSCHKRNCGHSCSGWWWSESGMGGTVIRGPDQAFS